MNLKFPKDVSQFHAADGTVFHCGVDGTLLVTDRSIDEFLKAGFTAIESAPALDVPATIITDDRKPEENQQIPQQADSPIGAIAESESDIIAIDPVQLEEGEQDEQK
jgi:hypothetical protein